MATYDQKKGLQSILDAVLDAGLGLFSSRGFSLRETDDHTLTLYHYGSVVCTFSQLGATIPAIHRVCREHLVESGEVV